MSDCNGTEIFDGFGNDWLDMWDPALTSHIAQGIDTREDHIALEQHFIVVVAGTGGKPSAALSRRTGRDFSGPWRLLEENEAKEIADAWNAAPDETDIATVIEVFRSEHDPEWVQG